MRLNRFYLENFIGEKKIELKDCPIFHQIKNVLKMKVGEQVSFFNQEMEFLYKIEEISKKIIIFIWLKNIENKFKPKREIILFQSLIKKDKMEWVVQKATELGVTKIFPIISKRSEKKDINLDRLNKIIIEAVEQCGRLDLPLIFEPLKFSDIWSKVEGLTFLGDGSGINVTEFFKKNEENCKKVSIIIGPEGGFENTEIELAKKNKVEIVRLNTYVLRSETASIAFLSLIANL
ncbi:16S rRNA (uracil(1498)-N(3))-methyltransferase [Candidatus Falkowbacteria bacterium HGW-Falkowbacteria-1]|uniref:Ribosomal RNA small subunit methyltransferase E n=1 Tax=Candidatus Falkowbacteria bacterium HGW-Falkowbacteria-1 TaxID=2013768 RepID=A0A2N2E8V2_9BACT|nr:MAG: 16S rRNA (uracil(1498)-N(3))-methyltransferase [Candidatus Falkowbacteria bacterium HGW-Falkowbacteria-1]